MQQRTSVRDAGDASGVLVVLAVMKLKDLVCTLTSSQAGYLKYSNECLCVEIAFVRQYKISFVIVRPQMRKSMSRLSMGFLN